jgi:urease accessory protein
LAEPAVAGGRAAVASVLKVPADETVVAAVRALEKDFAGEVGASAWNGLAVARLVAADGAALHHDLNRVLTAFADMPRPRLWLN